MLRASRLVSPDHPQALPQLWDWQQPSLHNILLNAQTLGRRGAPRYFRDWSARSRANAGMYETH
jgi:hypothetical protein